MARVDDERKSQAIVEAARQSETLAPELITDLRSISRESNYFEDAQSLLSQARNEEAQDLFERAQSAYEDGDLEAGLTALNELMAVAPRHEGAQQLQSAIEEALDEEYEREQQADEESSDESPARQDAAVAAASSAGDAPRPTPPAVADDADDDDFMNPFERDDSESGDDSRPRRPRRAINFTEGFSLYREGNFDAAIDHFDAIADSTSGSVADRARRVADDIGTYRDAINAGISARDSGDFGSAVEHFQQARQTDISVGGDGGFFETEVAQHLAITLADQGLTRLEAEDYSGAYASLERAQAQEVNHRRVRQLLSDLEDQANAFYIRAANQRLSDPDAAADLCHKILTMVPPSSDIHQRARQMLDELN